MGHKIIEVADRMGTGNSIFNFVCIFRSKIGGFAYFKLHVSELPELVGLQSCKNSSTNSVPQLGQCQASGRTE